MTVEGETALPAGGSRGIGAVTAMRLAADGAEVAITYAPNKTAADAAMAVIVATDRQSLAVQGMAASFPSSVPASRRSARLTFSSTMPA